MVVPGAMLGVVGCIVIETSVAGVLISTFFTLQPERDAERNTAATITILDRSPLFMAAVP
jgi:hypothetical protein